MEVGLYRVLHRLLNEKIRILTASGVEDKSALRDIKLFDMGAEAIIAKGVFLDIDAVIKWRFPKEHMPPELDKEFRRSRTAIEAKALLKSTAIGINVPIPLYADPDEGLLIMTYIDGQVLRDILNKLSEDNIICSICRTVGSYVAKLHENSIVHGDVTTGNILIEKGSGDVYLIDFGLANFIKRLEDQAIDVHIFFRSIESVHYEIEGLAKRCFIEGYKDVRKNYVDRVLDMVTYIRRMGRYTAERRLKGVWTT